MDSTPPSLRSEPHTRPKSASRLSKLRHYSDETGSPIPQLSLEIIPSSPMISTPSPASTISPRPPYTLPLRDLLRLSPSPLKRSKARLAERMDMADDAAIEASGGRKRCKSRNPSTASPRSSRRLRKRVEQDIREDRDFGAAEEILVKPRKKKRTKKDKSLAIHSVPSPRTIEVEGYNLDRVGEVVNDLIIWRDVSKSSLWFGFGSLCFLSSCFTRGVNFSIFSFLSQVGLLFLGVSFFSNSIRQPEGNAIKCEFKLTEDDVLKVGKLVLPAANLALSKTREIFSGEPAMTLKVVPFLLLGAEYGHLITLWRLCALGFFMSFTFPKLYSVYSSQLSNRVEFIKSRASEAWGACTHKKIVAASIVTAFWNLTSIRTRIFAAFLCLVIFRYRRQYSERKVEENLPEGTKDHKKESKTLIAVDIEQKK